MIRPKVLLLFLCGLAAGYLALSSQTLEIKSAQQTEPQVVRHINQTDLNIRENIKQIVAPVLPHLSDHNWEVRAIEHHGPHAYVEAEALGAEKSEGNFRFIVKLHPDKFETLGTYLVESGHWQLIYGKDPIVKEKSDFEKKYMEGAER